PREPVQLPGGARQARRGRPGPHRRVLRAPGQALRQPGPDAAAGQRGPRGPRDERGALHDAVTRTSRSTPSPTGSWTATCSCWSTGTCERPRTTWSGALLVGDTGIEPVTSSVSGKRATAAPI